MLQLESYCQTDEAYNVLFKTTNLILLRTLLYNTLCVNFWNSEETIPKNMKKPPPPPPPQFKK